MTVDSRAFRMVPAAVATWAAAAASTFFPEMAGAIAAGCGGLVVVALALLIRIRMRPSTRAERAVDPVTVLAVVIVALAFAAAAAATTAVAAPAREAAVASATSRALEITAQITAKPERSILGWRVDAVAESIRAGAHDLPAGVPVTLLLEERPEGLDVGARLHADATAFAADAGERAVLVVRVRPSGAVVEPPTGTMAVFAGLRAALLAASGGLPAPGAGLIPGLAVGDTSQVAPELDEQMKAASLSHLTAVSGANCAIVVGLAFLLAAALGLPRGARVAAGLLTLGGFVLLVTPEPSVVRAATMSAVAMLALLLGRRGAGVAVLALSVAVLLAGDPWLASSLGFALSVAATGALLVLAPPLARGLERVLPRAVAVALAVPLAAQLVCGPLIVLITPGVSLYGVAANLLAGPAAPAATILGLSACLAAPLPALAAGLTALAWVPAAWIAATAEAVSALPGAILPWAEGLSGLLALTMAGVAITLVILRPGRRRIALVARRLSALGLLIAAGVLAGTVVVAAVIVPMRTPHDWRIAMCDIGQGDAVLLRSAGRVMLVDTGPDPDLLTGCLDRLGIGRLDVAVLTHFDLDHVGGAAALAGRTDLLVHGPVGEAQDERTVSGVGAARTVQGEVGMRGTLGDAMWRVLWPASAAFPPGNDASVVVEIEGPDLPRTILLGDLGADAQRALLSSRVLHPPYRVVKLSHHGSADQEPALYRALGAELALISVGIDNDYGHPRDEALRMAQNLGMSIARTDQDGLVLVGTVSTDTGIRLTLWRERAPPGVGGAE
ncbi:ComEC/Rec2 family competence protein [Microbacterium sp. cx-59]|uniref:ComEC/Rec2 family competence protein n=1 Tax=Microbacterium sp. cx-59 TaxID=2891207 RepID=UPI001E558F09|nr:ComEC/Rec2 family competence protein [Microbacterium sp. cx-59]MCC4907229.1 ComEC/Rec2 family competence protein [Microbacterium sp. cx-59]